MSNYDAAMLDRHAYLDSPIHRLDPRAKLLTMFFLITTVVSFPKYALSSLAPFIGPPVIIAVLGFLPLGVLLRRIALASPFFILVGLFNPFLDRSPAFEFYGMEISRGWVSFASIALRGMICVAAAIALVATTSFPRLLQALQALRVPQALTVQLMLLYRYLFVLIGEGRRMGRAKALRSGSGKTSLHTAGAMLSSLLIRSLDRSEAIWLAMQARGFEGRMVTAQSMQWRPGDTVFFGVIIIFCVFFRWMPLSLVTERVMGMALKNYGF